MRRSPSPWTPERCCFLKVRVFKAYTETKAAHIHSTELKLCCVCLFVCPSVCVRRPGTRPPLSSQKLCISTLRLRPLPSPLTRRANQRRRHVRTEPTHTPAQDNPVRRGGGPWVGLLPGQPAPGRPLASPEHQRASGEAADVLFLREERHLSQDAPGCRHARHTRLRPRPPGHHGDEADAVALRPSATPAQRGAKRRTRQEDDMGRADPAWASRTPGERV